MSTSDMFALSVTSIPDCAFVRGPDEHEATGAGAAAATGPGPRDLGERFDTTISHCFRVIF